jgi:hypothetical protein
MGDAVDDSILGTFAVIGEPEAVGAELVTRYGGLIDRVSFYAPYPMSDEVASTLIHLISMKTR